MSLSPPRLTQTPPLPGAAICFAIDCHTWRAKVRDAQRYSPGRVLHPIRESRTLWHISWRFVTFWQCGHLAVEPRTHGVHVFILLLKPRLSCKKIYKIIPLAVPYFCPLDVKQAFSQQISAERLSVTAVTDWCSPPLYPHFNPAIKHRSHGEEWQSAARRYGGNVFLLNEHSFGASASCFLSLGENRTVAVAACGEQNRKAQWKPGKKRTLAIVKRSAANLSLTGTNISLWFHYFTLCEDKYTCWWMSMTCDLCAASLWCWGNSAFFNTPLSSEYGYSMHLKFHIIG